MKRVLIIDDDPTFTFELESHLKDTFDVTQSVDAMSAVSQIDAFKPHLIFLDIDILGDLDGMAVLKAVRENKDTQQIPIVVMTNLGAQRKSEFLQAGANAYFLKGETSMDDYKNVALELAGPTLVN